MNNMMQDLIGQVTSKAGISADQAQMAINAVVGFISQRVPQLSGLLGAVGLGGAAATGTTGAAQPDNGFGMDDVMGMAGGMLGGNRPAAGAATGGQPADNGFGMDDAMGMAGGMLGGGGKLDFGQLVKSVGQQANLNDAQAHTTTSTIVDQIRQKVPQAGGIMEMLGLDK